MMGPQIVRTLLADAPQLRVLYKPHPLTGTRDPRAAKGQPGQAKAMSQMYEQFAKLDGLPYATDMNIKASGEGPMAGLMAKMGNMTMTTTTESVDTAALNADLIAPPAGYKLNPKK